MATHSSILAWETPWTEEPSGVQHMCAVVTQSVMSNSLQSIDCSPPGSSVHGILQAGILEWVISFSKGSSQPRDQTHLLHCRQTLYCLGHLGSSVHRVAEESDTTLQLNNNMVKNFHWLPLGEPHLFGQIECPFI